MCSRYRGVKEVFEYINVCVSVCEYSFQFSFVDFSASFPSGSPKTMIKLSESDCRNSFSALKDQRVGILPFELNFIHTNLNITKLGTFYSTCSLAYPSPFSFQSLESNLQKLY